jgi:hypothetical protein
MALAEESGDHLLGEVIGSLWRVKAFSIQVVGDRGRRAALSTKRVDPCD